MTETVGCPGDGDHRAAPALSSALRPGAPSRRTTNRAVIRCLAPAILAVTHR
jgi:hypothetical protein